MMQGQDIDAVADRLRRCVTGALGVKARSLEAALRKAGRRLPARLHRQGAVILEAQALGGNPKLMRMVDTEAVARAEAEMLAHLKAIDRADVRRGKLLGLAGVIVFNLLIVVVAFLIWARATGHL